MERIFITGMSMLTSRGNSQNDFWRSLNNPSSHDMDGVKIPLDIPQVISNNVARRMDRFAKLTLTSAVLAIEDSSFYGQEYDPYRIGTVFNTGYGPINSSISFSSKLLAEGVDMVSPTVFAGTVTNSGIGHTCINLKIKGASTMLGGSNSIGCACDLLDAGKADALFVGGIDEYSSELYDCFKQKDYVVKDNDFICRPMDMNRSGIRISEGAAVMVFEREDAPFFNYEKAVCEVLGYGTAISYSKVGTATEPIENDAFINAMKSALDDAHISNSQIDGIFMAANGGKFAEQAEATAIHNVFGERAAQIPVTAIKGAVGETMGASFCLNTIAAAIGVKNGMMPPTIGCIEPDRELGLNIIFKETLKRDLRYVMVNGFDVSNNVYSLILKAK